MNMKSNLNSTLINISTLGSATLINASLVFIVGILTRNILGPEQYGFWVAISLIFTFIPIFQLGTLNAMNREVPFYLKRNDLNKVREIRESVFSFLFTFPIYIVGFLVLLSILISFSEIKSEYKTGLFLASLIVFFSYISGYIETYFKSQQDFKTTSKLFMVKSIATSLLTLIFVFIIGYEGLYIGLLLALLIQIFIARKTLPINKRKYTFSQYKKLIKIGFPILLVGIIWSLMIASDRIIITIFLTPKDLGDYSVSILVFSSTMLLPQVIGQVFYPKIVEFVSQGSNDKIRTLFWKVNKILAVIMLIVVVSGYIALPYFISWFMPDYVEGIKAAQILLLGVYPLTLVGVAANYFNSTHNQKVYIFIQLISIVLNILLSIAFLQYSNSINSVALATSMTFFIYFILMNITFIYKIRI